MGKQRVEIVREEREMRYRDVEIKKEKSRGFGWGR